jgi:hypothetical protein
VGGTLLNEARAHTTLNEARACNWSCSAPVASVGFTDLLLGDIPLDASAGDWHQRLDWDAVHKGERRVLAQRLAGWRQEFLDVKVTQRQDRPVRSLLDPAHTQAVVTLSDPGCANSLQHAGTGVPGRSGVRKHPPTAARSPKVTQNHAHQGQTCMVSYHFRRSCGDGDGHRRRIENASSPSVREQPHPTATQSHERQNVNMVLPCRWPTFDSIHKRSRSIR